MYIYTYMIYVLLILSQCQIIDIANYKSLIQVSLCLLEV